MWSRRLSTWGYFNEPCALVLVMYTREKAGEPIFKPLVDMDAIVPNIEEEKKGPSEVAMAVVSK